MSNQNLYELTSDLMQLQDMLLDSEFSEEAILEAMSSVEEQFANKAEGYVIVMKNMEAFEERIKNEEKRLAERRKSIEKKIESMKNRLFSAMVATDTQKLQGDIYTLSLRKSPASVGIIDEKSIPETYFVAQPSKLDRKSVLDALKGGEVVDGAYLITDKKSLIIK